jgi:hypothetical protein
MEKCNSNELKRLREKIIENEKWQKGLEDEKWNNLTCRSLPWKEKLWFPKI